MSIIPGYKSPGMKFGDEGVGGAGEDREAAVLFNDLAFKKEIFGVVLFIVVVVFTNTVELTKFCSR